MNKLEIEIMNSTAPVIALMSPGDMGHAVGDLLRRRGLRVVTSLQGRSRRTEDLAKKADFEIVTNEDELIQEADLLLSIMVPAQAEPFAQKMVSVIEQSSQPIVYVDCNAIAPETAVRIGSLIEAAGGIFVDAGIIGPPPRHNSDVTRFYASGAHADRFAVLGDFGLDIRIVSDVVGQASAVKMCYAALTKGTTALMTGLSMTAERLGVSDVLHAELELSQRAMQQRMQQHVPTMIPKAHRWVGEMEEIARTFEAAGLTPKIFEGAAEIYQHVAKNSLAQTTQEEWNSSEKTFEEVVENLSE